MTITSCVIEDPSPAIAGTALVEAIGVGVYGPQGYAATILPDGCDVPCEKANVFSTATKGQESIPIHLYRGYTGNGVPLSECVWLGEFVVSGLAPLEAGTAKIEISLVALGSRLELRARDLGHGQTLHISRTTSLGSEH